MHEKLCSNNNSKKSIISECFQGQILVETFTQIKNEKVQSNTEYDLLNQEEIVEIDGYKYSVERKIQKFL